jgi:hypothetical protein
VRVMTRDVKIQNKDAWDTSRLPLSLGERGAGQLKTKVTGGF